MDREVNTTVRMSTELMALAALIGIIAFTVFTGNEIKVNVTDKATVVQTDLELGQLQSLAQAETTIMPKASIYYILSKQYYGVSSLTYKNKFGVTEVYKLNSNGYWSLNGVFTTNKDQWYMPASILSEKRLEGKVAVTVTRINSESYSILINEDI